MSEMLNQLKQVKEEAKNTAATGEGGSHEEETELPAGVEAKADNESATETNVEESAAPAEEPEAEELIKIGDKEFKSQAEAIKYAESLAFDKAVNESYSEGIREALRAQTPVVTQAEPEENWEEKFYADPKAAIKEAQARATQDAIAQIKAEASKEQMWTKFFDKNPDLSGSRGICENVLKENWDTLGKMTDIEKAMEVLARKTRAIFQDYNEKAKPRTEVSGRSGKVVSSGSGHNPSVTQTKKEAPVLTMAQQMRQLKERR